jgi:hypothetical protein
MIRFSVIEPVAAHLLTVRKLIFRHDALNPVRLDPISEASVRLDRHTLNDGVDFRRLDIDPTLRSLAAMKDFFL